jgi:hypothetical protein
MLIKGNLYEELQEDYLKTYEEEIEKLAGSRFSANSKDWFSRLKIMTKYAVSKR